ncbi:MAG: AAA family ATPase [Flavobacterium sp.]|uniref:AAA family ATPase n=1 Tax=Flavobacterium sp. TaxID=239 RepID=UPI003BD11257
MQNMLNTLTKMPTNVSTTNPALDAILEQYLTNTSTPKRIQNTSFDSSDDFPQMSQFRSPIKNTTPYSNINIYSFYERITTDQKVKLICDNLSSLPKEAQRQIKATELDYITPSGVFNKRSNNELIAHSGYLSIDFDNIPDYDLNQLKTQLINDNTIQTVLLFKSPSGNGLKWFIKIPPVAETHGMYFDAVKNYIQAKYTIEVDKACRDVARACFVSYDEDAELSIYEAKPLDASFLDKWLNVETKSTPPAPKPTEQIIVKQSDSSDDDTKNLEKVNVLANQLVASKIDITNGYENWLKIGFSLCELDEDGREPFHLISSVNKQYDYNVTDEKYTSLLNDYDGSTTLGTLFFIAKPFIEQATKVTDSVPKQITMSNLPRTAKQRLLDAEQQPEIKKLLGNIWMTGELHILFADTGTGKSAWATQIADSLSKGKSVFNVLPNENKPLRVLYYDFELSDKQFQKRYSEGNGNRYDFSDNLFVDNIDFHKLMKDNPKDKMDELLTKKIKADVTNLKADVLVIDNLTFLKTESSHDTSVAMHLVKELKDLKDEYGLSILVLAHTPKVKNGTPLTLNELGGSKHLSNFADSVSAIGKSSKAPNLRYIKQAKGSRSGEMLFDSSNVIVAEMKLQDRFLGFHYVDCEYESEHLQSSSDEKFHSKQERLELIRELTSEGLSTRGIEARTGISKSTVDRLIKQL